MGGLTLFCDTMLRLVSPTSLGEVKPNLTWMEEFRNSIKDNFGWILVFLAAGAAMYGIYLGINLARMDKEEKALEAKKRIVNFLIGIAVLVALGLIMFMLLEVIPTWFPDSPTTTSS